MTTTYRKTKVYAEWNDKTYPAEVADYRWNGWVIPRFDKATAERIVKDQAALIAEYGTDVAEGLVWEGDVIKVIPDQDDPFISEGDIYRMFPDDDGMYHIGAENWTWTEVTS